MRRAAVALIYFRDAVFIRYPAILKNKLCVQGQPLPHFVVNFPVPETFHIRRNDEIRHPLGHAFCGIGSHGDDAELGDSAVADVSLLPVGYPVLPVAHGGRPHAGIRAVVGDDVVGSSRFLRHPDGEMEMVVVEERFEVTLPLTFIGQSSRTDG